MPRPCAIVRPHRLPRLPRAYGGLTRLAADAIAPASLYGADAAGGGCVRVMTIHASKGLEFLVTAVAECWGNPRSESQVAVVPHADGSPACGAPGRLPQAGRHRRRRGRLRPRGRTEPAACRRLPCLPPQGRAGGPGGEGPPPPCVAMTRPRGARALRHSRLRQAGALLGARGPGPQRPGASRRGRPGGRDLHRVRRSGPARVRTVVVSTSGGRGKPKEVAAESAGSVSAFRLRRRAAPGGRGHRQARL